MSAPTVCSECGQPVGIYLTPFGRGWMHVEGTDALECADQRGDQDWRPIPATMVYDPDSGKWIPYADSVRRFSSST